MGACCQHEISDLRGGASFKFSLATFLACILSCKYQMMRDIEAQCCVECWVVAYLHPHPTSAALVLVSCKLENTGCFANDASAIKFPALLHSCRAHSSYHGGQQLRLALGTDPLFV